MEHSAFPTSAKNSHFSSNLSIHLLNWCGSFEVPIKKKDIINQSNNWSLIIDGDIGNVSIS